MDAQLSALLKLARQPQGKPQAVPKAQRPVVPRFSRADDDAQQFEAARAPVGYERIRVEDQTLVGGLPSEIVAEAVRNPEAVYEFVEGGHPFALVLAEAAGRYGVRDLEDVPEDRDSPEYWELHAAGE